MKKLEKTLLFILLWMAFVALPIIMEFLKSISLKNLLILFARKFYLTKNRLFLKKDAVSIYGIAVAFSRDIECFGKISDVRKFTSIDNGIGISKTGFIKVKSQGEILIIEVPLNLFFKCLEEYLRHQRTYKNAQKSQIYRKYYEEPIKTELTVKAYKLSE
jgi:hypothetical protein